MSTETTTYFKLRPGWLRKVMDDVKRDVDTWPRYMRQGLPGWEEKVFIGRVRCESKTISPLITSCCFVSLELGVMAYNQRDAFKQIFDYVLDLYLLDPAGSSIKEISVEEFKTAKMSLNEVKLLLKENNIYFVETPLTYSPY